SARQPRVNERCHVPGSRTTQRLEKRPQLADLHVAEVERFCLTTIQLRQRSTLFPYTTLFRSAEQPHDELFVSDCGHDDDGQRERSEEHTSELQSLRHLVCRLLLEKKKAT